MTDRPPERPRLRLVNPASDAGRHGHLGEEAVRRPAHPRRSVRLILADDNALARAGYRALLEKEPGMVVVGETATAAAAVVLATRTRPDVLVLNLALPDLRDPEATAQLVTHLTLADVAVMIIASDACNDRVPAALASGAVGLLRSDADPAELAQGVHLVAGGRAVLPAEAVRSLIAGMPLRPLHRHDGFDPLAELTPRERDIVALVARGLTNAEISEHLVISPATAKTHVSRAMLKLGARHRVELVVLAYEGGLMNPIPDTTSGGADA